MDSPKVFKNSLDVAFASDLADVVFADITISEMFAMLPKQHAPESMAMFVDNTIKDVSSTYPCWSRGCILRLIVMKLVKIKQSMNARLVDEFGIYQRGIYPAFCKSDAGGEVERGFDNGTDIASDLTLKTHVCDRLLCTLLAQEDVDKNKNTIDPTQFQRVLNHGGHLLS
jgi:hypothetical protein